MSDRKIKLDHIHLVAKNHMEIPWSQVMKESQKEPVMQASLIEKAAIIGRVGLIMLSCGTGAWRVRDSNTVALTVRTSIVV